MVSQGVDSILEISVLTVGLTGDWDVNPSLAMAITGRTRLIRAQDGTEIHASTLAQNGGMRMFTEWAADDARLFREELDRGLQNLAEEIVREYFLVLPSELNLPGGSPRTRLGTSSSPTPGTTGSAGSS